MALKWWKDSEYSVCCEICGQTDSIRLSDGDYKPKDTPTKYFKRQGWSDSQGQTLCKDCTEKLLRDGDLQKG